MLAAGSVADESRGEAREARARRGETAQCRSVADGSLGRSGDALLRQGRRVRLVGQHCTDQPVARVAGHQAKQINAVS